MIITINGVDGVGKSQQIKLLRFYNEGQLNFTQPLVEYSSKWPKLTSHDMFNWWFKGIEIKEFIEIVINALNVRYSEIKIDDIVIFERGTLMFKAVCAATMSVRIGNNLNDSIKEVDALFGKRLNYDLNEEYDIVFFPNAQYQQLIKPYIILSQSDDYTAEEKAFYNGYQKLLRQALDYYFDRTIFKIVVDKPIWEIQNKLRLLINNISGISLPEICSGIKQIVGFGGLSECGKSSFANHLRDKGYYRLKLGYFLEILKRYGAEVITPENIAMEFLHFCKAHYYVDRFTIESLHEPYTPAYFKLLFGAKFKIVYLDAPFEIRSKRASIERSISLSEAEEKTLRKDQVKEDRGARIVKEIADINFDNSGGNHLENMIEFEEKVIL